MFNAFVVSHIGLNAIAPVHRSANSWILADRRRGFDAQCDIDEDNVAADGIFEVDLRLLGVLGLLRLAVITLGSHSVGRGPMRTRQRISQ